MRFIPITASILLAASAASALKIRIPAHADAGAWPARCRHEREVHCQSSCPLNLRAKEIRDYLLKCMTTETPSYFKHVHGKPDEVDALCINDDITKKITGELGWSFVSS